MDTPSELALSLAGWRSRAQPHPSPASFMPSRDALDFAVVQSTMAFPYIFVVALFSPNIAVDAAGNVLILLRADFTALVTLVKACSKLPVPPILGQWRVHHSVTCQPFNYIWVVDHDNNNLKRITVYGYRAASTTRQYPLERPVEGITELPDALVDILGLSYEAYVDPNQQSAVVRQIRKMLVKEPKIHQVDVSESS